MPNNIPSYRDVFAFLKRANNVSDFKAGRDDIQFRATKFAVDGINRKIKPAGLTVTHVKDDVYSVPRGLDKWMKVPDLKEANNINEEIDSTDKHTGMKLKNITENTDMSNHIKQIIRVIGSSDIEFDSQEEKDDAVRLFFKIKRGIVAMTPERMRILTTTVPGLLLFLVDVKKKFVLFTIDTK